MKRLTKTEGTDLLQVEVDAMPEHLLAIDQGTSGTTVLCLDLQLREVGRGYRAHRQYYPQPGWVEHDPVEILDAVHAASAEALKQAGARPDQLAGVGITNQRETVVAWSAETGEPVAPAIVWQCRRTTAICEELRKRGREPFVRERTGLLLDPYFSAAKIAWLLDAAPGRRALAERGRLRVGTIDTWLIERLTGEHLTDATNASRTSLMDLRRLQWDAELLDLFRVPAACLPRIVPSAGLFGVICHGPLMGASITGVAGDQQAALFGHRCCRIGQAKNTYGTGCFLLVHAGTDASLGAGGVLTTAACGPSGDPQYAREGSVFIAGAAVQWLRDELGILETAAESETLARQAPDTGGVVFVPAFTGLGAPYWDPEARGAILGLTRGAGRPQIARAVLEAIALQSVDLVGTLEEGCARLTALNVDGGATANSLLMQIQADLLGIPVLRARQAEMTALGAACLAGVGAGVWRSVDEIPALQPPDRFDPRMDPDDRQARLRHWRQAVAAIRLFGTG